jgi:hypothetical protein
MKRAVRLLEAKNCTSQRATSDGQDNALRWGHRTSFSTARALFARIICRAEDCRKETRIGVLNPLASMHLTYHAAVVTNWCARHSYISRVLHQYCARPPLRPTDGHVVIAASAPRNALCM